MTIAVLAIILASYRLRKAVNAAHYFAPPIEPPMYDAPPSNMYGSPPPQEMLSYPVVHAEPPVKYAQKYPTSPNAVQQPVELGTGR